MGRLFYRFFLGDNAFTNFEVERNAHYNVTLNLTGKGGVDEASWRVTKDFNWILRWMIFISGIG